MGDTLKQNLVHQTLSLALGQCLPDPTARSLLFHSDRGSQYTAHSCRETLGQWGIVCSMSGKGNYWDNAPVESVFATLKKELVYRESYQHHEQARASLFHYTKVFYNRRRRHSALSYKSPHDYEQSLLPVSPP